MALPIKSIPVLTSKALKRFNRKIKNVKSKSINFTKELETTKKIIEKSKSCC